MAHRVPITIRVDHFEGPLDLLLYLIQSHELDVSKVSISKITDQYLAYVRLMQELNFDIASDFLLMAATLIQWKSKSLLPQETDPNALANAEGEDALTPEELLRQLREHQRFLEAGRELATLPLLGEDVYVRPNSRKPTEKVWKRMDVSDLALTFQDLLVRERKRTTVLKKETVSLAEKILDFSDRMEVGKLTGLRSLLRDPNSRPETVVSFLATLELGRLKKLKVFQEKAYEEIYVELLESIKGFDTSLASGFDSVTEAVDQGVAAKHAHDAELTDEQRAARYVSGGATDGTTNGAVDRTADAGSNGIDRNDGNVEPPLGAAYGAAISEGLNPDYIRGSVDGASRGDSGEAEIQASRADSAGSAGDSPAREPADFGGAPASDAGDDRTEDGVPGNDRASLQLADLDRTENAAARDGGTEVLVADHDRAADTAGARSDSGSGLAGSDSGDLAALAEFGESRDEPDLAAVLSGTGDGSGIASDRDALGEELVGEALAPTDGGRDGESVGRDS